MSSLSVALSSAWLIAQCLLTYEALIVSLVLLAPLLQVFVWFYLFKILERVIIKKLLGDQHLSPLDSVWLPQENNLLYITSVLSFESEGSFDELVNQFREAILERMVEARKVNGKLLYPRFRCYIRPGLFQYFFREDRSFDIENHVLKWEGEVPQSKDELAGIVSQLSNEPLPDGRSLWRFVCIPTNFGNNDFILLFRISHALADGISFMKFLTYQFPDKVVPQKETRTFSSTRKALPVAKAVLMGPFSVIKKCLATADQSLLHGPDLSGVKKCVWTEAFDLQLVKDIKSATFTTVNDVLMSCITMALRRYFQRKGVKNPVDLTASIPVDVRAPSKDLPCDNQFTFIFPKMATATEGLVEQLNETQARMNEMKASGESFVTASLLSSTQELCPQFLSSKLNVLLADKASCVFSNVPGPQHILSVRGRRMKYLVFFPPHKDHLGVGLSVFSYAGQAFFGVQGDDSVLPDPEIIAEEFGNALNEMAQCVLHGNE
ncbi:putative diacyglycerol O-acyltransferase MT1809 [Acropora muricata]|uniref:putative diacyglycerol O-acyltransferase MT1809 n=1 Tax=Acropora muricata TaxID=159855 RepID=UPI0034E49B68